MTSLFLPSGPPRLSWNAWRTRTARKDPARLYSVPSVAAAWFGCVPRPCPPWEQLQPSCPAPLPPHLHPPISTSSIPMQGVSVDTGSAGSGMLFLSSGTWRWYSPAPVQLLLVPCVGALHRCRTRVCRGWPQPPGWLSSAARLCLACQGPAAVAWCPWLVTAPMGHAGCTRWHPAAAPSPAAPGDSPRGHWEDRPVQPVLPGCILLLPWSLEVPASTTISILIFIIFILIFIFMLLLPPVLPPSMRWQWGCAGGSRRILPSLARASHVLLLSPHPLMSP